MTDNEQDVEKIPHPEDCDHKFILKGGVNVGSSARELFQCERCGYAYRQQTRWPAGEHEMKQVHPGWNPKPESEPDEEAENDESGGWLFG